MMNQKEWGIITAPEGGIMGVHSLSDTSTIKKTEFSYADSSFEGTSKYSDWKFIYISPLAIRK
jgi:hypothetical protein